MANIATLEKEITTLRANIDNDAIPAEFKGSMKTQLEKLEKELAETVGKAAKPAIEKIAKKAADMTKNLSMDDPIKPWYAKKFPTDDMVDDIFEKVTFNDVYNDLPNVYEITGAGDSLVRERIFNEIAKRTKQKYAVIYEKWLNDDETEPVPVKPVNKAGMTDAECEELIKKQKEALKKRKARDKKQENKSEPQKQRERIEKAASTVEKSIKERIKSGKPVTKKEVESLIDMYEKEITDLKKLLKTL